jgi:hypothetical protein
VTLQSLLTPLEGERHTLSGGSLIPLCILVFIIKLLLNPSLGGRDRKIMVGGQPGQKLARPYVKNKSGIVAHACNISYLGVGNRRIVV